MDDRLKHSLYTTAFFFFGMFCTFAGLGYIPKADPQFLDMLEAGFSPWSIMFVCCLVVFLIPSDIGFDPGKKKDKGEDQEGAPIRQQTADTKDKDESFIDSL